MAQLLFVGRNERTFGPFSSTQLRQFAASGKLRQTDTIWQQGQKKKAVTAAKVKNLFLAAEEDAATTVVPIHDTPTSQSSTDATLLIAPEINPQPTDPDTDAAPAASGDFDKMSVAGLVPLNEEPRTSSPSGDAVPVPEPEKVNSSALKEKQQLKRAIAIQGATITGQDGVYVQFRKKCTTCGYEDNCRSSMRIVLGLARVAFFCRKCRKSRDVQLQGMGQ